MASDDLIGAPRRADRVTPPADSRLHSVFLQHRLIGRLEPLPGIAPAAAKFVVEQIVDRLLALPGGTEPLMLLDRDGALLADGTAVAVLAVAIARAAGWPASSLPDLGASALLARLGHVLDADDPARAAFRWFLERPAADVWLRCALVARHRDGAFADDATAGGCGAVALVRLAAAVHAVWTSGGASGRDWAQELRAVDAGLPDDLVALAPALFAGA